MKNNLKELTKLIQKEVGASSDGVYGINTATAIAEKLGITLNEDGVNLWCPFADTSLQKCTTRGEYPSGYPEGAIVHYTSGWQNASLADSIEHQVQNGYTYFVIDEDGNIAQSDRVQCGNALCRNRDHLRGVA